MKTMCLLIAILALASCGKHDGWGWTQAGIDAQRAELKTTPLTDDERKAWSATFDQLVNEGCSPTKAEFGANAKIIAMRKK